MKLRLEKGLKGKKYQKLYGESDCSNFFRAAMVAKINVSSPCLYIFTGCRHIRQD